jgi:hypothetical protein
MVLELHILKNLARYATTSLLSFAEHLLLACLNEKETSAHRWRIYIVLFAHFKIQKWG